MKSGIEPRIIVTFITQNAIENASGTLVNNATMSRIARAIQIMNKTIVEFFMSIFFLIKGGDLYATPV